MRDFFAHLGKQWRDIAFGACALCTLWLVVQNAVLFTLLPWERMPAVLQAAAHVLKAMVAAFVPVVLLGGTLALGWLSARSRRIRAEEEMHHE